MSPSTMTQLYKVVFILAILLIAVDAKHKHKIKKFRPKIPKIPLFPYLPPFDLPRDYNDIPGDNNDNNDNNNNNDNPIFKEIKPAEGDKKDDFEIASIGSWEIISENSGVSAMHVNLLPSNKIIVYDAKIYRMSRINLPDGVPCLPFKDANNEDRLDCFAHAVEYDIETNQVRPLKINGGDPWCSSGGLSPTGTLVSTGGFADGARTIRHIGGGCIDCEWREYDQTLVDDRWYATQQLLPNGEFILVGGRKSFTYEYIPLAEGQKSEKSYLLPFLYETSDIDENNLYPFVHLSTDGNLFIFSNNRSLLLNPTNHKIVRTFPILPGGSRNYPASGQSALLPIDLNAETTKAEVIVCGGNRPEAFQLAETKKAFLPALQDCNRLTISEPFPEWDSEMMPSRRTMGDAIILPNGQLLFINGAQLGTSAWWDAEAPNYTPALYNPEKPKGTRFKIMKASQIARMYHSTSVLLPSGKIWIGGSNTHDTYRDEDKYPTETRIEAFSPPYLNEAFNKYRPQINEDASQKELTYGNLFETEFSIEDGAGLTANDIKVTMYAPPFTTHGFSMGQRLVILKIDELTEQMQGNYKVRMAAPPSGVIAPPGYYLLYVVHRGIPGKGMWVWIH
ncbi:aldehyde oxidase GLOX1 [Trifolium repens]|nr:aldehyde oxidase GLOX1 [Trifolium repens]